MKLASIDLGTNTCNLSIAEWSPHKLKVIHAEKQAIKLGAEGFPNGNISEPAIQRVLSVLTKYKKIVDQFKVEKTQVFATSGVRNAKNQQEIISRVRALTGYQLNIISGEQEAEFIYLGVRQAVPMDEKPYLLLDIGGGSNEIQIASMEKVYYRKSFDLGIARLLLKFQPSDPLTEQTINDIRNYLSIEMKELVSIVEKYQPKVLIGSSGSFDTFASMYIHKAGLVGTYKHVEWYEIPRDYWLEISQSLIQKTREERLKIPGMEAMRVEMIPLASVFTEFLINLFQIRVLIRSAYALKEGVFQSMARNLLDN
ncbi:MAG: phosphatase [Bacteroidota bacterium]|nr:phosphatase [Bacteroidota bacterium]